MFYVKNIPALERTVRMLAGVAAIIGAVLYFGPTPMGWVLGAMGVMSAASGLLGFCPACALAGRRLSR